MLYVCVFMGIIPIKCTFIIPCLGQTVVAYWNVLQQVNTFFLYIHFAKGKVFLCGGIVDGKHKM